MQFTTLRPSSADFPKLALRSKVGPPKAVRESEKIVDEKITRRTEEYIDEATGERRVRTVEYVEKLIEREVPSVRHTISPRNSPPSFDYTRCCVHIFIARLWRTALLCNHRTSTSSLAYHFWIFQSCNPG